MSFVTLFAAACSGGPEPNTQSKDPYERFLGVRELSGRRDAQAVADIVRLLDDKHSLVVAGALEALGTIRHPEFLQHIAPKVKHEHPISRAAACKALGDIRNAEGIPFLAQALGDADPSVRRAAVKALATFGAGPEATPLLVKAVGDKDPGVALLAHEALQNLTGKHDVARSAEAWSKALP